MARAMSMPNPILLMIRAKKQADEFVAALQAHLGRNVQVCFSPLIRIEPVPNTLDLQNVSHLLFTSTNAVERFAALCPARSLPALCVGEVTATRARALGMDATSVDGTASDLARVAGELGSPANSRMLYLRGKEVSFDLKSELEAIGTSTSESILYQQLTVPLSDNARDLLSRQSVIVPLFSAKGARAFLQEVPASARAHLTLVCMSTNIASLIDNSRAASVLVASSASRQGMIDTLGGLL